MSGARGADERGMALALELAKRSDPSPNPRVGAIVVSGPKVVACGWHRRAGEDHAEVIALRAAGRAARGATLYVTLEPCNHFGRTPPCVDAILASRVARVVVGCRDPNPQVSGGGVERLRARGVDVAVGVLEAEAVRVIELWSAQWPARRPPPSRQVPASRRPFR